MRRWLFTILALLSLALLIGSVVLWVRSVRVNDQLAYRDDDSVLLLMTAPHGLCLQRVDVPRSGPMVILASSSVLPERGWSVRTIPWGRNAVTSSVGSQGRSSFSISFTVSLDNQWVEPVNGALGFGWETQPRPLVLVVPFWFLVILFAIVPFVWIRRTVRDRARRAGGLCPRCGYDLRATPGRCPECGREVPDDFHPTTRAVESAHQ